MWVAALLGITALLAGATAAPSIPSDDLIGWSRRLRPFRQ